MLPACAVESIVWGAPVETPAEGPLWDILVATLRDHDPDADPTAGHGAVRHRRQGHDPDGHARRIGFSPLRLEPDERFLERFHGVDERVSLAALRFGLPVLYDVVRRFCG